MRGAYYNELDPYAADWLRNLIAAGHIAPGDVDTRDIRDVRPDDIRGYTQCHFFAGIGVWSYALRMAGWPDDRPVWTGSCPCQPFSAAGAGLGFADERHLWPHWFHLISERRPATVLGEQVASKDVDPWIDLVQDDMESLGDAFGALAFPAASVGSPNIRDRTYWVAHADNARSQGRGGMSERTVERIARSSGLACGLADSQRLAGGCETESADHARSQSNRSTNRSRGRSGSLGSVAHTDGGHASAEREQCGGQQRQQPEDGGCGVMAPGGVADTILQQRSDGKSGISPIDDTLGRNEGATAASGLRSDLRPGPTNGFWRDADWLFCRDGRWRPVEPGTFPLAHGATARVGRLRAYGNAINAEAAAEFIRCAREAIREIA